MLREAVRDWLCAGRTRWVHWPVGLVAFCVLASFLDATSPHMRASAFVVAELVLAAADAALCLLLLAFVPIRTGRGE
jgi:hypothetical protein